MMNVAYKIAEIGIADRIEKIRSERLPHLRWLYRADWRTSDAKEEELLATVERMYAQLDEVQAVLGYSDSASDYARDRNQRITEWDLDVEDGYENMTRTLPGIQSHSRG